MSSGFLMLKRGPETLELLKDGDAFLLLTQIAYRARRSADGVNPYNLAAGEAMLGDYHNCGLSERRARTAKAKLAKWGLATFRATNRGTIAKLCNSAVFDANIEPRDEQNDRPATSQRQAKDERRDEPETTNNKEEELKKEKKERAASRPARFVVPTLEEVEAYCREDGCQIDAQAFLDNYQSKGWLVGTTPMRDWKAAVRSWARRDQTLPRTQPDPVHLCAKRHMGGCNGPGVHRHESWESGPYWLCDAHEARARQVAAEPTGG
ncbi:MAG: hypothetical protein KBI32_10260 [Phycisphaerae bacterium]|nr:hypothetical protein [Phycisphaerae bacterium]